MTKNSEVYGTRTYFENPNTRTIEKTDSIVDAIIDQHIKS